MLNAHCWLTIVGSTILFVMWSCFVELVGFLVDVHFLNDQAKQVVLLIELCFQLLNPVVTEDINYSQAEIFELFSR